MTQARSIPLSEDELEQLEALLVSDEVPADCMNLEMLDGYLAAIAASPLPIAVEDWLPAVWTADEGEVGFGSGSTLQKAIELVLRYYNDQLAAIGDEEGDEEGEAEGWQPFCYAQGDDDVREFFKEKVYRNVIPRNVRLGEAPSHGLPAVTYDARSRGAEAYTALAREFLARNTPQPVA